MSVSESINEERTTARLLICISLSTNTCCLFSASCTEIALHGAHSTTVCSGSCVPDLETRLPGGNYPLPTSLSHSTVTCVLVVHFHPPYTRERKAEGELSSDEMAA